MEQAIAEAARIVGAVVDVGEAGGAEQSRTGSPGSPGRNQGRAQGPQGLLLQQEQILSRGTTASASTTSASPSSTQVVTPNATVTPIALETPAPTPLATPMSTPMATSTATSGAALTVSPPTANPTEHSSQTTGGAGQVPIVKNLSGTLAHCILCQEFRDYLILLDSKIPKPKFQVKLAKTDM